MSQEPGLRRLSRLEVGGWELRQDRTFRWSELIVLASARLERVTKAIPMALLCS